MNFTAGLSGVVAASLLLCSCAGPRTAPRFDKPSTSAIAQSHKEATGHVKAAKKKAEQLEKDVPKEFRLQVVSLRVDLDNALTSLDASEGARKQLDSQLQQQTTKANKLADSYDKASLQITSLEKSRHRWVKYFATSALLNALALGWIFRKPIFALIAAI
jgi:uncharacterized coiled-coil DUF342 family protein